MIPFRGLLGDSAQLRVVHHLVYTRAQRHTIQSISDATGVPDDMTKVIVKELEKYSVITHTGRENGTDFYALDRKSVLAGALRATIREVSEPVLA